MQQQLAQLTQDWLSAGQDVSFLVSGLRLEQFEKWAKTTSQPLTPSERAFLESSLAERDRQQSAEVERRQRESRLERRSRYFLRGLVAVVMVATLGAMGLTSAAVNQSSIAQAERARAEQQSRIAQARELVGYATSALNSDAELSALLAIQAVNQTYRVDGTVLPEAETMLHQAVQSLNPPLQIAVGSFFEAHIPIFAYTADGIRVVHPSEPITDSSLGLTGVSDAVNGRTLYTLTGQVVSVPSQDDRIVTLDVTPGAERFLYWDISSPESGVLIDSVPLFDTPIDTPSWIEGSADFRYFVAVDGSDTTRLWDITTGEELTSPENPIFPRGNGHPAFSQASDRLANRNPDGTLSIFNTSSWEEVLRLTPEGTTVDGFKFSPDGSRLITRNRNNTVSVWDAGSGEELFTITPGMQSTFVSLSRDGSHLAVGGTVGQVKIWNIEARREVYSLTVSRLNEIILNPNASRLATWHNRGQIQIWEMVPGRESHILVNEPVPDSGPVGLAYSPDGSHVVVASFSNTPTVWDVESGREVVSLQGHTGRVQTVAWSPDGRFIATGGEDTDVIVWDAATGETVLTLSGHSDSIYGMAFSPDSVRLASSGYDSAVRVWDVASGEQILVLEQPSQSKGVDWSSDGLRLAASSDLASDGNGHVRVWDASTGELQLEISVGPSRTGTLDFSPDGGQIAVGLQEAHRAQVFDAQTGEVVHTFVNHVSNVPGVAYSPDGMRIATSGINEDGTIRLWDAATGQPQLTLFADSGVARVAFSPDGGLLASQHHDGTTRIYILSIPELMALAESRLTRGWTPEECQRYLRTDVCPAVDEPNQAVE